jgi:MFS family permease
MFPAAQGSGSADQTRLTSAPAKIPHARTDGRTTNVKWLIAIAAFIGMLASFSMHLVNLRMQNIGISGSVISLSVAIQALAICISAFAAKSIFERTGLRSMLAAGAILSSGSLAAIYFSQDAFVISALRVAFAAGLTPLVIASEYIVTVQNRDDFRGHVVAWYATALGLGTIAGPLLLSVLNIDDASSFTSGAAMLLLSGAALRNCLSEHDGKTTRQTGSLAPILFMPAVFYAAFVFGVADNGGLSMLPVYGALNGYSNSDAAMLAVFAAIGATASPFPIAWLATRYGTTRVLVSLAICALTITVLLPVAINVKPIAFVVATALGALIEGLYTVALISLSRERRLNCMVSLNACFISVCSLGEVAGPAVSSVSMEFLGPHGFVVTLVLAFTLYVLKIVNHSTVKSQC